MVEALLTEFLTTALFSLSFVPFGHIWHLFPPELAEYGIPPYFLPSFPMPPEEIPTHAFFSPSTLDKNVCILFGKFSEPCDMSSKEGMSKGSFTLLIPCICFSK